MAPSQVESALRLVCGSLLWFLSSLLTAGLLLAFAENLVEQVMFVALAGALEGAKVLSWRMGRSARVLAVSLIILSVVASFAAALGTVQDYRLRHRQEPSVTEEVITRHQQVLLNRLERLPEDFTTAARELNQELGMLRQAPTVGQAKTVVSESSIFDTLAKMVGLPVETVMLILLLFIAVNLEAGALVLTGHRTPGFPKPIRRPKPLAEQGLPASHTAFLNAMVDGARLPTIHGRDVTAQRLGISFYEAKRIVADLKARGIIRARGKRLILCHSSASPDSVPRP